MVQFKGQREEEIQVERSETGTKKGKIALRVFQKQEQMQKQNEKQKQVQKEKGEEEFEMHNEEEKNLQTEEKAVAV